MIILKNELDLIGMRESAKIASSALRLAKRIIREGISAKEIDEALRDFIISKGARPSFLGYKVEGKIYNYSTCVSINEEVVHGLPLESKILKGPMLVKVDVGVEFDGYHSDTAWTFSLGDIPAKMVLLMKATKEALYRGIDSAKPGKRVSDITYAIYETVKRYGFEPARGVTGHGIGLDLHEDPLIFNHPDDIDSDYKIKAGMALAIEPMITAGNGYVKTGKDGWTISTKDGSWSAHYEHTVFIGKEGPIILTEDIDV